MGGWVVGGGLGGWGGRWDGVGLCWLGWVGGLVLVGWDGWVGGWMGGWVAWLVGWLVGCWSINIPATYYLRDG